MFFFAEIGNNYCCFSSIINVQWGFFVIKFCSMVLGKMSSRSSRTLYVGNLPGDIRLREVEDLFYKV